MRRSPIAVMVTAWLIIHSGYTHGSDQTPPDRERIALVIGNDSYVGTPLDAAVADAKAVAKTLTAIGFEVQLHVDQDRERMDSALRRFGDRLRHASRNAPPFALFYYAGHGIQSGRENYLIPVDDRLESEAHLETSAVPLARIIGQMEKARTAARVVILDACRNELPNFMTRSGLAEAHGKPGTLVIYATAPGTRAQDSQVDGGHSPFTAALLEELPTPGLDVEDLFERVRRRVVSETSGLQTPWRSSHRIPSFALAAAKVAGIEPVQNTGAEQTPEIGRAVDPRREFIGNGIEWTVSPHGNADYHDIRSALKVSGNGDVIKVRAGTYIESLRINKEIYIEGDGRDSTIIEADSGPCLEFDAWRGAVRGLTLRQVGNGRESCVNIKGGELLLEDNRISSRGNSAIVVRGAAKPLIVRNEIHNSHRAGIHFLDGSGGRIERNQIVRNNKAGIAIADRSAPMVLENTIDRNGAVGIVVTGDAKGTFANNAIAGHAEFGVQVIGRGAPLFEANNIVNNKRVGLLVAEAARGTYRGNVIRRNGTTGLIVRSRLGPFFTSNTITNNHDGLMVLDGGRGRFEDNDVEYNQNLDRIE